MATITTKFSVGDAVYCARTAMTQKQHPCPDCNGSREWTARSPAGGEYTFACPRCTARYLSNDDLSLRYSAYEPAVTKLTIGSVEAHQGTDRGTSYMCVETGVGSGLVYYENELFDTREEADKAAANLAHLSNIDPKGWVAKRHDKTIELSDYQLENALLKGARDARIRHSVKLQMLFDDLRDCETVDEITRVLDDFKLDDDR